MNGTLTFTAQPQHNYTFYVELKMQGSTGLLGSGSGEVAIQNLIAGLAFK